MDELPAVVTETTVARWGFTKNVGTIIGVRMNGVVVGTAGYVDLGTVLTKHQEVSAVAKSGDYADLLNAPTEIATATQRKDMQNNITPVRLLSPNILYDWSGITKESLTIPNLGSGDVAYDNKWMVRFSTGSSDNVTIPFDVMWKDGVAPSWSEWVTCEMIFTKDGLERVLGEWKIYK